MSFIFVANFPERTLLYTALSRKTSKVKTIPKRLGRISRANPVNIDTEGGGGVGGWCGAGPKSVPINGVSVSRGGTWVCFGLVCAARDSKLALRSKKNFPYPVGRHIPV